MAATFRLSTGARADASDRARTERGLACRLQWKDQIYDLLMRSVPPRIASAPASHATVAYHSNQAFLFTGRDGETRPARLLAQPDAGVGYLSPEEETTLPDDFLEDEMSERFLFGPTGFVLYGHLPGQGDSILDPATEWRSRRYFVLGRLRITALLDDNGGRLDFDPTRLPANIALTDDPILQARHAASVLCESPAMSKEAT